jgi:predicted short-subunit dehydrogenase-like oxidoreductase (DUF2520 family)
VILAVPDQHISHLCKEMAEAGAFEKGQVAAHLSGAHTSGLLEAARNCGAWCMSLHPAISMAGMQDKNGDLQCIRNGGLSEAHFVFEGDRRAKHIAREFVEFLDGSFHEIAPAHKPLYHSACVIASNFLIAQMNLSVQMLHHVWTDGREGEEILYTLLRSTLDNVHRMGVHDALTGPVIRGDMDTIRMGIDVFSRFFPTRLPLYLEMLGVISEGKGVPASVRRELKELMADAPHDTRTIEEDHG